jgi:formylglycine-generating enzyme required for sulfatase activity
MIAIPAGSFRQKRARLAAGPADEDETGSIGFGRVFAISKLEITEKQWSACVTEGQCRPIASKPAETGRKDWPATEVSWRDAKLYADWLSAKTGKIYRLLSEAEWEYIARAGSGRPFRWGSHADEAADRPHREGRLSDASARRVSRPSGKDVNAWGIADLDGNVVEWVADCWLADGRNLPPDGKPRLAKDGADCSRRVLKGGSWLLAHGRRVGRFGDFVETRDPFTGFRVAREF